MAVPMSSASCPVRATLSTASHRFSFGVGVSIQEAWYNAGKRLLPLDLSPPPRPKRSSELARRADILIEDWAPRTAAVRAADLEDANPAPRAGLHHAHGADGPMPALRANDLVANASRAQLP